METITMEAWKHSECSLNVLTQHYVKMTQCHNSIRFAVRTLILESMVCLNIHYSTKYFRTILLLSSYIIII